MMIVTFFFFNDTATTEIYTLSLHDALPIFDSAIEGADVVMMLRVQRERLKEDLGDAPGEFLRLYGRSEEHTSELQSRQYLVCRLLLEKKKKNHLSCHTLRGKTCSQCIPPSH